MPISLSEYEKRRLALSSAQLGLKELCVRVGELESFPLPLPPLHWNEFVVGSDGRMTPSGRVVFRVEGEEFHSCVDTLLKCGEGVWIGELERMDRSKRVIFEVDLDAGIFSMVMDWGSCSRSSSNRAD